MGSMPAQLSKKKNAPSLFLRWMCERCLHIHLHLSLHLRPGGGGMGILPIMAYTGRLRPKGVSFSGFRYMKG